MTDFHTGHTGIRGNKSQNGGQFLFSTDVMTIPKILKKSGYVAGAFRKRGLGYLDSTGDPLNLAFDEFCAQWI